MRSRFVTQRKYGMFATVDTFTGEIVADSMKLENYDAHRITLQKNSTYEASMNEVRRLACSVFASL